jgi:hypothetical protein
MQILKADKSTGRVLNWVLLPLFFMAFYLILLIKIRPELIYQFQEPVFYFNQRFFSDLLKFPGGFTLYCSRFLSQFFLLPWLGAMILTVTALMVTFSFKGLIHSAAPGRQTGPFVLVPAMALLIMHSQYEYQLNFTLGLLITLSVALLFIRLPFQSLVFRLLSLAGLSIALYILAGGPALLFLLLVTLDESAKGRWPSGLLMAACLVIPYLLARTLFLVTVKNAYGVNLMISGEHRLLRVMFTALLIFIPLSVLLLTLIGKRAQNRPPRKEPDRRGMWLILQFVLVIAVTGVLLQRTFNGKLKESLLIDRYARFQQWDKIIETTRDRHENFDLRTLFHINHALYHTARLMSDMFGYRQIWGAEGLLLSDKQGYIYPLQYSDLFLNLHHVNEAEHWAHESMSLRGETAWTLERLATVNLVKGETSAAHMFASKLSESVLFRKKGRDLQDLADHPDRIARSDELVKLRNAMLYPQKDFIYYTYMPDVTLERILANRPDNLMAFEYLMAYYLLTGQLNNFMKDLPRARAFGYEKLPRHFEEAVLLYFGLGGERNPELLKGFKISNLAIQRFQQFQKILSDYKDNKPAAFNELKKQYGDTYWFYALYVQPKESQNG